jgi:hypothetical protein
MKSLTAVFVSVVLLVALRWYTAPDKHLHKVKVTTWDALGYYYYVPGWFIYHDVKQLDWLRHLNEQYQLTPHLYQANRVANGNYAGKYFLGVSALFIPFFGLAHFLAPVFNYPADGFSPPYQLALCAAAIFYATVALLLMRHVLLGFFSDSIAAATLSVVVLGTNFPVYAAMESAQIHVYIFFLYAVQIGLTIWWYKKPNPLLAFAIGWLVGYAIICRPTEAVMLFIPLFWMQADKEQSRAKWFLVKKHSSHILLAFLGGCLGILPQLIYWKAVTGNWIYNVGSKWVFFNPWWRVLIGWEKGWFIYTPVAIFLILGLWFMKDKPFKKSVAVFTVINLWIVISWFDWRYGGSYSTRALVQSYPVLMLPFASFLDWATTTRWRYGLAAVLIYLTAVNVFQILQFHRGIIHYDHMNRKYYQTIYLNPHPQPLDYSLLDTDEILRSESGYSSQILCDRSNHLLITHTDSVYLCEINLSAYQLHHRSPSWVKVSFEGTTEYGLWNSFITATIQKGEEKKTRKFRLFLPCNEEKKQTLACFYLKIDENLREGDLRIALVSTLPHKTWLKSFQVKLMKK